MRVYIDNRERTLVDILTSIGVPHVSRQLDVGDIDMFGESGQRFILERKTLPDLAASLRDGRFKSQKDRLLGVLQREPATAIAYVVEGDLGENDLRKIQGRVSIGTIRSLLNTIQFRYRIPVITTKNIRGTALLIRSVYKQVLSKPDFCPVGSGQNAGCAGHADLMPKIRRNRRTDNGSLWTSMLTAIPGVSNKISSGVVSHFEGISQGGIVSYVRTHSKQEFQDCVQTVRINGRRLAKKVSARIISLMYPDTPRLSESSDDTDDAGDITIPDANTNPRETSYHPGVIDMYVSSSPLPEASTSLSN